MEKELTYEEWLEKFKPIKNADDHHNYYDADGNATYGYFDSFIEEDRKLLEETPSAYIWTLVNEDNFDTILSGVYSVNRLNYYITEVPVEEGVEYFINMGCCCDDEIPECCEECCKIDHNHFEVSEENRNRQRLEISKSLN